MVSGCRNVKYLAKDNDCRQKEKEKKIHIENGGIILNPRRKKGETKSKSPYWPDEQFAVLTTFEFLLHI